MKKIIIKNKKYKLDEIYNYCKNNYKISLSSQIINKIKKSRKIVEDQISTNKPIYGINTGFGKLSQIQISAKNINQLQENLLLSHSVGVGNNCPDLIVKIMILLKIISFTKGFSGVRISLVEFLVKLFNNNYLPIIPSQGSVGASGDLAPLSHLSLIIIGKGKIKINNKVLNTKKALKLINLKSMNLEYKEGLGLINGTQYSTAYGVYCLKKINDLVKIADISGAMSVEAMMGTNKPFSNFVNKLKPFKGQNDVSINLTNLLKNSEIMNSHKNCNKVQDIYSLRCMPQVHGSSRDLIYFANNQINIEINSVSDNPLVFTNKKKIISAGHFHAEAVGHVLDIASIAITSLSNISERRTFALLLGENDLPKFLVKNAGLNSGFMMLQVTAAALASENKMLANPSSTDSIPTCSNQEDYVSMAPYSGRKLMQSLKNLETILAIELLCAIQGIDFRKGLKPAKILYILYKLLRTKIPFLSKDRLLKKDIDLTVDFVRNGILLNAIRKKINLL